jgi:hypothetical protein
MGADCSFVLNRQQYSPLITVIGRFSAFSGLGPHRNNPDSIAEADAGPLPTGTYHIVDRASGGRLGPIRDWVLDRDKWFALYKDDGSIDDQTFVSGVKRGEFRLHPLGPRRMSSGCVVLAHEVEFDRLRAFLLKSAPAYVGVSRMRSYGTLMVGQIAPAVLDPKFHFPGPKAKVA